MNLPNIASRPRRTRGRILAVVAVAAMIAMWGYVVYLAFGPGRADPPDRLSHPTFATDAQEACSTALDRIGELPLAIETTSAGERADVLQVANGHLEDMLGDLDAISPDGEEGDMVRAWLDDWRIYLGDRQDYAARLRQDDDARLLVTAKAGDHITEYIDGFAQDNNMPACSTPTDAA